VTQAVFLSRAVTVALGMAASPASASAVNFMAGKLRVVEGRVGELIAKYEFLAHKIEQMEARVEALKGERSEKQEVAEASRATVAVGTESPKFLRVCMCDGEEQAKVVGPMLRAVAQRTTRMLQEGGLFPFGPRRPPSLARPSTGPSMSPSLWRTTSTSVTVLSTCRLRL